MLSIFHKKYENSQKVYNSLKSAGSIYSWHASLSNAVILTKIKDKESAISALKKDFGKVPNPDYQHYFELANFYKDTQFYEEAIKYYSLALKNIDQNHILIPKILDRRGTSYERSGDWDKAENDLENERKSRKKIETDRLKLVRDLETRRQKRITNSIE